MCADHRFHGRPRLRHSGPPRSGRAVGSFSTVSRPLRERERAREELSHRHGVEVRFHGADLREPAQIEELMQFADDVDIVINNAVTRHFAAVEEFPVERWNEALAVNVSAAFHTIRLALPSTASSPR